MDGDYLKPLQTRVSLAKQIHTVSFRQSKVKKTESWFARSAKVNCILTEVFLVIKVVTVPQSRFRGGPRREVILHFRAHFRVQRSKMELTENFVWFLGSN